MSGHRRRRSCTTARWASLFMWVLQERPDLSFAVNELSRAVQRPMGRHWGTLKRLLHYLRGTKTMELGLE
eukprot:6322409-Heterocapsa_arctica.AAC.1